MRIDYEYLKTVLQAFAASAGPVTDIVELGERGLSHEDPKLIFHMSILQDKGFIEQEDGAAGFGMSRSCDGFVSWAQIPLRLTAAGHEFLAGLENQTAWTLVKTDLKSASIETLKTVFKTITEETAKAAMKAFVTG